MKRAVHFQEKLVLDEVCWINQHVLVQRFAKAVCYSLSFSLVLLPLPSTLYAYACCTYRAQKEDQDFGTYPFGPEEQDFLIGQQLAECSLG